MWEGGFSSRGVFSFPAFGDLNSILHSKEFKSKTLILFKYRIICLKFANIGRPQGLTLYNKSIIMSRLCRTRQSDTNHSKTDTLRNNNIINLPIHPSITNRTARGAPSLHLPLDINSKKTQFPSIHPSIYTHYYPKKRRYENNRPRIRYKGVSK